MTSIYNLKTVFEYYNILKRKKVFDLNNLNEDFLLNINKLHYYAFLAFNISKSLLYSSSVYLYVINTIALIIEPIIGIIDIAKNNPESASGD